MNYKELKAQERELHELLYNNMCLLSGVYKTTEEFNRQLKKDMLFKSNKQAFFQMVYYLLYNLNPEVTKRIITSWPLYDPAGEVQFKTELMKLLLEIKTIYKHAEIPNLMASHFVSPGGVRIITFLLHLSNLLIYETLNKTPSHQLQAPKDPKHNKVVLNVTKARTKLIEAKVAKTRIDNDKHMEDCKAKAKEILEEHEATSLEIMAAEVELEKVKQQLGDDLDIDAKFGNVQELSQVSDKITELLRDCESLVSFLSSDDAVLKHDPKGYIPAEVADIVKKEGPLDLIAYFKGFELLLRRNMLELPNWSESSLDKLIDDKKDINCGSIGVAISFPFEPLTLTDVQKCLANKLLSFCSATVAIHIRCNLRRKCRNGYAKCAAKNSRCGRYLAEAVEKNAEYVCRN